jgi:hypothetical protein
MELPGRIEAFARLGEYLERLPPPGELKITGGQENGAPRTDPETGRSSETEHRRSSETESWRISDPELRAVMEEAQASNPWFIPAFVHHALAETARLLKKENLGEWTGRYPAGRLEPGHPRTIGTVMAGNIPLAGFHDFLSILMSGNRFRGKLSARDDKLLPFLASRLTGFEPRLAPYINFEESRLGPIDAMIATGSDNSSRYFEYYFGRYPHIFRRNRNGTALLDGTETEDELERLADDIFIYFGMGCRSVAKLFVPRNYDFAPLFRKMEKYNALIDHHKYANNYLYQRTVFLMNRVEHLDNGFLLVRPEPALSSPVATLHYETWEGPPHPPPGIRDRIESIQCIAGRQVEGLHTVRFGRTQYPELWDYADEVDTMDFLLNLYEN